MGERLGPGGASGRSCFVCQAIAIFTMMRSGGQSIA